MPKSDYVRLHFQFDLKPSHAINRYVDYKKTGYWAYFNAQHILYKLNKNERGFLDFLIEHADAKNKIYIDSNMKESYNEFLVEKLKSRKVSTSVLSKAVVKLKNEGLLIEDVVKTSYWVNPKYFWRSSEQNRMNLLRTLVMNRAKNGLSINCLIDCEESDFLKSI